MRSIATKVLLAVLFFPLVAGIRTRAVAEEGPYNWESGSTQAPETSGGATAVPAAKLKINSPHEGQVYHPGDRIDVAVAADKPIKPQSAYVDAPGVGSTAGTDLTATGFKATLFIPDNFVGPLSLNAGVNNEDGSVLQGDLVMVNVQPPGSITNLVMARSSFVVTAPAGTVQLQTIGQYGPNWKIDVTDQCSFSSSNNNVLSVSKDGLVQLKGYGMAFVTASLAANSPRHAIASFLIEDPNHPLPPQDVTKNFSIQHNNIVADPSGQSFSETLTINYTSRDPTLGPLYLVFSDLPSDVWLPDGYGTQELQPAHQWFIPLLGSGGIAQDKATFTVNVKYETADRWRIKYTPKIYRYSNPL